MFVAATEDELSMCSGHVDAFGALLTMRVREPLDVRPRPPLTQPVTPTLPSTIPIPTPNVPHPTAHPDIGTAARVACARRSRARRRTRRGLYHRVHRRRNNVHPIHVVNGGMWGVLEVKLSVVLLQELRLLLLLLLHDVGMLLCKLRMLMCQQLLLHVLLLLLRMLRRRPRVRRRCASSHRLSHRRVRGRVDRRNTNAYDRVRDGAR